MLDILEHKTILVTGATGFIGQHLLQRLQGAPDLKILALTRQISNQTLNSSTVTWLNGSLGELTKEFWARYDIQKIDFVLHLGAFIPKKRQDANNVRVSYEYNLHGTRNLLDSLPSVPNCILFASTVDVYKPVCNQSITEHTPPIPSSLYGASKLFCEQMIINYAEQHHCGYALLRYGHIYGPGEIAYQKFIPEIIRKLANDESPVIYGDGSTLRDFLYVTDAVEATIRALVHPSQKLGPVNIVSGQSVSLCEIVNHLLAYIKNKVEPQYVRDKSNGLSLLFDNSLMMKLLGEWAFMPLQSGLRLEYDYFKQYS
jgi:nucleoside-diphosphate-sugar epimerase